MQPTPRPPAPEERALDRPLAELSRRFPVVCRPEDTLRHALETLQRENVGSIVVVDQDTRPLGIITLGDVLTRIALPQCPLDTPVPAVMSANPVCLPASAPAFQAALLMARRNVRHIPLVDGEKLVGVVSESRLFSVWRRGIGAVRAALISALHVDDVVAAAQGIPDLPVALLSEGLGAHAISAMITSLNDLVSERLLELTGCAQALSETGGCWLALGSQGRGEQTLATDQDNAIVFSDDVDPTVAARRLLPLARDVNQALDRCGFELCRGGIMASNPALCLPYGQWRRRFDDWIDRPDAQALLNASIYFDFRPILGAHPLATALREHLAARCRTADRLLALMALNALQNEPPLGLLRDFVLSRGGEHPHTLDLKTNGVQLFVESARVLALAHGVTANHTVERLQLAGADAGISDHELTAWRDAFFAIQRLRLSLNAQQIAMRTDTGNHLDPDNVNAIDRNLLKDSLRQARLLQSRLARDFSLGNVRS